MNKEQQTTESKIIKLRGIVKFPFVEKTEQGEKFTCKLCLENNELMRVQEVTEEIGESISISDFTIDNKDYDAINVKTSYQVPIYDINGAEIDEPNNLYPIYDGAKVIFKVQMKRYEYKEKNKRFTKTGVTSYLLGAVVVEQGTPFASETTFKEFEAMLNEDNVEF